MADIILPQVDLLTSTNDNTNVLVEQGGQINRVNKSLFGSSDAETLNGHAASYFAPAASLSTTNTNVSNLSTRVSTIEGDYLTSGDITDYSGTIAALEQRIATLENNGPQIVTLYENYDQEEFGNQTTTLTDSAFNYDIICVQTWTYPDEDIWYEADHMFTNIQTGINYEIYGYSNTYRQLSINSSGLIVSWSDAAYEGEANQWALVPWRIYGIKL